MTRARDVADTQDNVGGSVPPSVAGKNAVINGGFDIWQRGTTVSFAGSTAASSTTYTADRWQTYTGTNQGVSVSRQATGDTTNLPNIQYCARYQRNSNWTGTAALPFIQNIESVNSIPFAGKTVTLSFYARAGANFSATSNQIAVYLVTGTGTDQNNIVGAGYTNGTNIVSSTATLTTTWQRFTYTATVGATATQLGVQWNFTPTGTAGANDYYEVTGVQLELGSVATPFSRAGGTIQGELAACQRYYEKSFAIATQPAQNIGNSDGAAIMPLTTDYAQFYIPFRVTKRAAPTITLYNPNAANALARNLDDSADMATTSSRFIGEGSFSVVAAKNAAGNTGDVIGVHWVASIEL